ncbi:MAG: RiPP maturation radical SAM C-methyltransferase [Thermoleophilia bacterium]|jgi:ribosomal peptide maturation radical SAM protein 1
MKVVLVCMPFAALERPALGVSLLSAKLASMGVRCDVVYLNMAFARHIGADDYAVMATKLPYDALAGEWVFSACLHGTGSRAGRDYTHDVLRGARGLEQDVIDVVERVRERTPAFIRETLQAVPWGAYDLVGFTSFSQQNLASLALAKNIRERFPHTKIVFGGGNWQAGIGVELHRRFPFVDFVCSGEADISFPGLVSELRRGDAGCPERVGGIVYRDGGRTKVTSAGPSVTDLDGLPTPDFGGFFESRVEHGCTKGGPPALVLETSRGCWWASRERCLFCGLNGSARGYRTKSPKRILAELRELAARWPCSLFDVVDNVVSPRFLADVLPELARRPLPAPIFFETRPELSKEQVLDISGAKAQIQPGLESLSDHVLALMHKGSTVLENVRLLKWCRQYGVQVFWNIIHGLPGETDDDYRGLIELLPALHHLEPPDHVGPLRLDRFSQYYRRQTEVGLTNVRPLEAYSYVYPFRGRSLARVAYAFDYDVAPGVTRLTDGQALWTAVAQWRQAAGSARLQLHEEANGGAVVVDARTAGRRQRNLDGLEAALYRACDDIRTRSELQAIPANLPGCTGSIDRLLASLVAEHLMITDGERFLALAVPAVSPGP